MSIDSLKSMSSHFLLCLGGMLLLVASSCGEQDTVLFPQMQLDQTALDVSFAFGVTATANETVQVTNIGAAPLNFTVNSSDSWLTVSPSSSSVAVGESVALTVSVDPVVLDAGSYTGTLTLNSNERYNHIQTVIVRVETAGIDGVPTSIDLSNSTVPEDTDVSTDVGTLTVTDPNPGDTHTLALVSGIGSSDNASFTLSGNVLSTATTFDFDTQDSYSIRVEATDSRSLVYAEVLTITITDVVDRIPTDIQLSGTTLAENSGIDASIGTFSVTDLNLDDTHILTLVAGVGDADNGSFTVSGNVLSTAIDFDFETKNSYNIRVLATDSTSLTYEEAFVISITDINETPVFSDQTLTIAESASLATAVGTVTATDPENDTLTYTVTAGNAAGHFSINSTTGAVTTAATLNATTTAQYILSISVTDSALTTQAAVTVNVTATQQSLTYDGNGSDGGIVPVDGTAYNTADSATVRGNTGALTQTGLTFVGWNTLANGSGTGYVADNIVTIGSTDVVLFAQWTALTTLTVTYDGNTNVTGTAPVDGNAYLNGATVTTVSNSGNLTKTGNSFVGWNTLANGSGTGYAIGDTFTLSTDTTLFAQWSTGVVLSLTYNANGSTGGSLPVDSNNYEPSDSVLVQANVGNMVKSGSTFNGWNTVANGTGTSYAANSTLVIISSNVTLFAQWQASSTFTVSYDANVSTSGTVPTDANTYTVGESVTAQTNTGTLKKIAFVFTGWNTLADGTGASYAEGATFTLGNSDVTLYANWQAATAYSLSYDGNEHTGGTAPVDNNDYYTDSSVTILSNVGSLAKTGHTLNGWNTAQDGSGTAYVFGSTFVMGTAAVKVYAQWVALPTFAITYDKTTADSGTVPVDTQAYLTGVSATVLGNTGGLSKTASVFVEWNTSSNGSGTAYVAGNTLVVSADVTLYAIWTINTTFSVTYNGNGSTGGSVPSDGNAYLDAATVSVKGNVGALTLAGSSFVKWNTSADGLGTDYVSPNTFTISGLSVTLYAQWTLLPTARVFYNGNTNDSGAIPVDGTGHWNGKTVSVLTNSGNLAKTGQSFDGWNTAANGSGVSQLANSSFTMGSSDVTLYAQWTAATTFSVTYDGNGSTAGTVPVDGNAYENNDRIIVLGNSGTLTQTGATFANWNTKADGTGSTRSTGNALFMGTTSVTLFAQWTADATYTVTYNGNTNNTGVVPVDAASYRADESFTVLANTGGLTKTGNTFVSWNTLANGTGTTHLPGATSVKGVGNATLFAQWTTATTLSVSYDGNTNDTGTAPSDGNVYVTGATITALGNSGNLTKTGFTFLGWNTLADGSGATTYNKGDTLTATAANVTLFAQWSAATTFTVIYNGNTSDAGTVPVDSANYLTGASVTVEGNTDSLSKTAATFNGWNTQANGAGTAYVANNTFTIAANTTLFAQWINAATFTVTYNDNTSDSGVVPVDSNTYQTGASVAVLANTSLAKTGFTFVRWNTAANGSGTNYFQGNTFAMATSAVTLYAQWTALSTYTVTYNGNASTGGLVPTDGASYLAGAAVTTLGNAASLTRTGYTFNGWNTSSIGSGTTYNAGAIFSMTSFNRILYAKWTLIPTYRLFYNGNGSDAGTVPTDSNQYVTGVTASVLGNAGSLARSGYTFADWNTSANGTGTSYASTSSLVIGTANRTLYAQWTALPTYTVTYDGNGSNAGNVPNDLTAYTTGASVTVFGNIGSLAKTGSTFVNWNTAVNGSGVSYAANGTFTMLSTSVTLYAQWNVSSTYAVTYNGNTQNSGTVPVDGNSYLTGASVTVLGNINSLSKTGNTFIGWNTLADGTGTAYATAATFTIGAANVTLYAQWTTVTTYSVTYDAGSSDGGAVPTDVTAYLTGAAVTVLGNTGALSKTGDTFVGWNTVLNGSGTSYATAAVFAIASADVTLYAQWTSAATFTVSYDGNGSTAGSVPSDSNNYLATATVGALANVGSLTRTGFSFSNWNTALDGSGTSYAPTATFTMGAANRTLYAQWAALPTFTITYNGNTNDTGAVPVDANTYLSGASATILGNTGTLAKTGNTFVGWNTLINGTGTAYAADASLTLASANVTLFAQWSVAATFTVTYDGNTSDGGAIAVDSNNYLTSETATVLGNTGTLSKTGSSFIGWNTLANGTGTNYAADNTLTVTANVTLFARWSAAATFTVTYNGNSSDGGTTPSDSNNYVNAATVTVLGNTGTLSKTGSTFNGWNTLANGAGVSYAAAATFTMGTSNVTLFAQWTALPVFSIAYNGNSNDSGSVPVDGNTYVTGATATVLANVGSLSRTAFTFVNWNTAANGTGTSYNASASLTVTSASVTLYAQWVAQSTYSVTYNVGSSDGGTVPTDSNTYLAGAAVTVLANTGSLTKTGSTFGGWNTISNGSGTNYDAAETFVMATANVTLYAQWTVIPTYTVTYNDNGKTSGSVPVDSTSYLGGATVTVLSNSGTLVKTGYTFNDWNTLANGNGTSYASAATFTIATSSATLYAQWLVQKIAPVADFTQTTSASNTVAVNGSSSSDADGTISSYTWIWGDGSATGTGLATSHTYTSAGTYSMTLVVVDNDGQTDTKTNTVTVNGVNTAPTFAAQSLFINESASIGSTVGTVTVSDSQNDTLSAYSISAGNTGSAFAINSTTGVVTTLTTLSYATLPTYSLTIQVSDGNLTSSAVVTIEVMKDSVVWDKRFGGSSGDRGTAVLRNSDGSYVTVGYSDSVVSGDKTETSQGGNDYWVVKIDNAGNKVWDKRFGGSSTDYCNAVVGSTDGGYILAGYSFSGISGDKAEASQGSSDYWVVKIDSSGNKVWDKRFGGSGTDVCNAVVASTDGGYVLSGSSESGISGDKTEVSQGGNDYWVVKIDSSGNKVWDKRFGGSSNDQCYAVVASTDGGYVLSGYSFSGISGDKTEASQSGYDYWVVKIDSSGNKVWDKRFGGSGHDYCLAVVASTDGGYVLSGSSASGISGNKTEASQGSNDYWVVKIDSSGTQVWDKRFGGSNNDQCQAVVASTDGGYVLSGSSFSGISGDKTEASQGGNDCWVVKIDSSGTQVWDKRFGGTLNDYSVDIVSNTDGSYTFIGYSDSAISGNKSEASRGGNDYWITRFAVHEVTPVAAALMAPLVLPQGDG